MMNTPSKVKLTGLSKIPSVITTFRSLLYDVTMADDRVVIGRVSNVTLCPQVPNISLVLIHFR